MRFQFVRKCEENCSQTSNTRHDPIDSIRFTIGYFWQRRYE
jgi:hypothetical protein